MNPKYTFFSKGHDGCLVHPGIGSSLINPKMYVTKLGTEKVINNEKHIYDNLPEEFNNVFYNKECYINDFNLDDTKLFDKNVLMRIKEKKDTKIIYNKMMSIKLFKGNDLSKVLKNKIEISKNNIYNLLNALIKFYEFIEKLNSRYNVYHKDITSHNIMWNIEHNSICLIDFAQSKIYSQGQSPHHLPRKDLDNTLDIINSIITYACNKFNVKISNVKTIIDLINDMKNIKQILH